MKILNIIITSILLITLLFSTSSFAQPDYSHEVNSSDILKQIENGEDVYISDSVIKGKLNLSSANLSEIDESGLKIVRTKITIVNSRFENSNRERVFDFSNTIFENEIEFDKCDLYWVDFSKSHFKQDVIFKQSEISNCNFSEIVFHKKADFRKTDGYDSNFENSNFNGRTFFSDSTLTRPIFHNATFTNISIFSYATFNDFSDFKKSTFSNFASFDHVNFGGVYFTDSIFNGSTEFSFANFGRDADFTNTTFNGSTEFSFANFGRGVDFTNTTFLDEVDFSEAVFTGVARFDNANFKKNADFKLVEFNNVNFIDTSFEEVSFANADFSKIYVEWDNIKDSLIFDSHFFIRLRENFIKIGEYGKSDDVYYEYRKNIGADKDNFEWFLDRAVLFICGYGVRPQNTIFTGFFVVLGFAGYYYCREHWMLIFKWLKKWQNQHISINIAMQNTMLHLLDKLKSLKIWTSPAVSSFMSHIFKKNDKFDTRGFWIDCWDVFWFSIGVFIGSGYESSYSKKRYPTVTMLEKILGSLIFTLFVVTLTNVLIRI